MFKKFCAGNLPSGLIETFSSSIYIKWSRGEESSDSLQGVWTTSQLTCCGQVALENHDWNNGVYTLNPETGDYQLEGSDYVMFRSKEGWNVGPKPDVAFKNLVSIETSL